MATSVIRIKKSVHGVGRSLRLKNSQLNSALTIAHPMPIRIRKGRKKQRAETASQSQQKKEVENIGKAREFDPFGHAGFDPTGIIRLTP